MNFLNVFEERVSGLFGAMPQGGTAPLSFKKLAKRAAREMENETFVIDGVDTAPALFTILVSSDDDAAMRPIYPQLTRETSQFIEGQAQGKGYVFVGKPLVRFMADPSLKGGKFSVFAENVDARTLERLREEERRFLGADSTTADGFGGAATDVELDSSQPGAPAPLDPTPLTGTDAGLDVMPQETILAAEEAAMAAQRVKQVPSVEPAPAPEPVAPAPMPEPVAAMPAEAPALDDLPQLDAEPQPAPAPHHASHFARPAASGAAAAPVAPAPAPQPVAPVAKPAAPQVPEVPRTVRVAPATTPAPEPRRAPATCLLIDRQSGRTYNGVAPRTTIGRERRPGGIVLRDPNVSRSHAELSFDGRYWHIRDLDSTNGTLVNDVDVDECTLQDGDLITLGLINLEFREG